MPLGSSEPYRDAKSYAVVLYRVLDGLLIILPNVRGQISEARTWIRDDPDKKIQSYRNAESRRIALAIRFVSIFAPLLRDPPIDLSNAGKLAVSLIHRTLDAFKPFHELVSSDDSPSEGIVSAAQSCVDELEEVMDRMRTLREEVARKLAELPQPRDHVFSSPVPEWLVPRRQTIGTGAITFTDIVGSDRLVDKLGNDHWRPIRMKHFERAEEAICQHNGFAVKTMGDATLAVFNDVTSALQFLLDFSGETGDERIQIRGGIHVGEFEFIQDDIFGKAVNYASRLLSAMPEHGIVISDDVLRQLKERRADIAKQIAMRQLPNYRLPKIVDPQTIWKVIPFTDAQSIISNTGGALERDETAKFELCLSGGDEIHDCELLSESIRGVYECDASCNARQKRGREWVEFELPGKDTQLIDSLPVLVAHYLAMRGDNKPWFEFFVKTPGKFVKNCRVILWGSHGESGESF